MNLHTVQSRRWRPVWATVTHSAAFHPAAGLYYAQVPA
jgi:hypothetical protein